MKEINVVSWGGGTQSTALMLMMLDGQFKDINGVVIKPDYIMFADTGDENEMIYSQIYKITEYIRNTYGMEVIITKKNKIKKTDEEIAMMIKNGEIKSNTLSTTPYADLYQEQLLFYRNVIERATIVPFYVIDRDTGELAKLPGRQCTIDYKIKQIQRELRIREGIQRFTKQSVKINMFIGFTVDEISRVKPSPESYVENHFPLVEKNMTKLDCIDYVKKILGFKPHSSACNMCFALTFDRVYEIYLNDKKSWKRILDLDDSMEHYNHNRIRGDVYMFMWQAKMRKRLANIDMDAIKKERDRYKQLTIFDVLEEEEQMACMGGCFI